MTMPKPVLWLKEIDMKSLPDVGGKAASLGEMIRKMNSIISVPDGFVITTSGYHEFISHSGIRKEIESHLSGSHRHDLRKISEMGSKTRHLFLSGSFPPAVENEIKRAYERLCEEYGEGTSVAVRSSATTEDLESASFAGQHDTFLNVRGAENVLAAAKKCFASLFNDRAISYRQHHGVNHMDASLAVVVQKMVRSDLACSGVIFSIDTESGHKDVVFITASYGLGEPIVKGEVGPDEYYVFKPTLRKGYRAIIGKKLGSKERKMIFSDSHTATVEVGRHERQMHVLTDDEILKVAEWAVAIESHYGKPMDIEWAKDGLTGQIFVTQARPETVHGARQKNYLETYILEEDGKVLITGKAVGSKIGQGDVNVMLSPREMHKFKEDQVLVTHMTDPDWEPIMKTASAIITNHGGRTCHAAIVSRELGIPCIVGTENATEALKDEKSVTVSCAEGEVGKIYRSMLKFRVERTDLEKLPKTRTQIMMNVGIPGKAFSQSQLPNDGVGLARLEFIIGSYVGIHPMALIHFEELKKRAGSDAGIAEVIRQIEEKTQNYKTKSDFFAEALSHGIGKIAAAFYPKDAIVRLSDFKSNEYANLIGGRLYEPDEHNSMLGWRGASRYYDERFRQAFLLECAALKRCREEMGLTNIKVMVPFCRTPEEGRKVIGIMEEAGLKQGEKGLEIYVMCEIPSNVLMAEEFADIFDGFSIGSNDLTQLTLGLDRDSELVSHIYDERNPAVKKLISDAIKACKRKGKKIGICGQGPSDFPDFAEFLVECGIDSISLNPDTVVATRMLIAEKERQLAEKNGAKGSL
ncbi:MAG: phosphoenolpyruvate synthase [Candidatus Aenigmarchaeota archaeon]|nr:phosphoenolpyruvate synthase [Candidatus Aenigmarchaeota archaeon]